MTGHDLDVHCASLSDQVYAASRTRGCGCTKCMTGPVRAARGLARAHRWELAIVVAEHGTDDAADFVALVKLIAFERVSGATAKA